MRSSIPEDSIVKTVSSPLSINNARSSINLLTCSDDSNNNLSIDESLSASIASTSNQQSVILTDSEDNVSEDVNNIVQEKTVADIITETTSNVIQKKKIVPPSDRFAVKKQKTMETIEKVLCQSSHALNVMATAYLNRATTEQQHPYIIAIETEAMRRIPSEQQLTCFMSIMQTFSTYTSDK